MPSQAPRVVSSAPGVARYTSHSWPMLLASSTFLARPTIKTCTPEANLSVEWVRKAIWSASSLYLMMGPAMSWGKRVTKVPKLMRFLGSSASPR